MESGSTLQKGSLGWASLAALGISLTAAGTYGPWGLGLDFAGWLGALIAFGVVVVFYVCLVHCLAEVASAIPSAGGAQAVAGAVFGPAGRVVAGASALVQYVSGVAALVVLLAGYFQTMTGIDHYIGILLVYGIVLAALSLGVGEALATMSLLAAAAIVGLVAFCVSAIGGLDTARFTAISVQETTLYGVWIALPFAVTFLLGLEGVAFAAEEAREPARDIPLGLLLSTVFAIVAGLAVLLLGPAGAGLEVVRGSAEPMVAALQSPSIGAHAIVAVGVGIAALCALGAAIFSSVYAYSRLAFAMARDGDLPSMLTKTNKRHAPIHALLVPSAVGLVLSLTGALDQLIIVMVFSACVYYAIIFASFISLRTRQANLPRPYRARFGIGAALVGLTSGAVIFSACLAANLWWSLISAFGFAVLAIYGIVAARKSAVFAS